MDCNNNTEDIGCKLAEAGASVWLYDLQKLCIQVCCRWIAFQSCKNADGPAFHLTLSFDEWNKMATSLPFPSGGEGSRSPISDPGTTFRRPAVIAAIAAGSTLSRSGAAVRWTRASSMWSGNSAAATAAPAGLRIGISGASIVTPDRRRGSRDLKFRWDSRTSHHKP